MYKNILAIGAHPDDVELGCAGTILKFQEQGAEVDIVVARDDNAPRPSVRRDRSQMQKEYRDSERVLGIEFNIMTNPYDDTGRPRLEWNNASITQMDEVVNAKPYDLIITHSKGDHHNDHQNTFNIVNSSLRRYRGEFWCMEGGPYSNKNKIFNPTVFVNITEQIEKKLDSVKCYTSYFDATLLHNIRGLAAYRGQMLGVKYAEAFELQYRNIH
jgi:LmbE family N-acetylglucosaminyl deacetylase